MVEIRHTLAIDFGSQYVGIALVEHGPIVPNRVLYAATLTLESKPLKALVETRAGSRRMRRTRKTHRRRLQRLAQAIGDVHGADELLRFCRRRGFSHDVTDEADEQTFRVSRARFFSALEAEIEQLIEPAHRECVRTACERHLNRERRQTAELRPARFENRGRSRCNWEGCRHNVPRAGNDLRGRLQQSLFLWLQPVFQECNDPERLRRSVEHWIGELVGLSAAYQRAGATAADADAAKMARKPINARIDKVYKNLRERIKREVTPEIAECFVENWKEYYRPIVSDAVRGTAGGRVRFCREHSAQFVEHVLAGKQIPNKQTLTDRDLISRTQQIVFGRLWRLIEARILPLAGGRIDRMVVERVAFDILSGPIKARQQLSEKKAAEMYQLGPRAGFASRQEMLMAEFSSRCAYCGEQSAATDVEHVMHQSGFPFDSYFNIVPACHNCNSRKGGRTALEAGMTIHSAAYEAYADYLRKKKVLHPYHTIKKGMLNLLQRSATSDRAQQMVAMIADNLVSITHSQRSPRPLARYLATRLEEIQQSRPHVEYCAGRHTALYRSVILPDYQKQTVRLTGDLRNHAVDAIILGCDLPSATVLENKKWTKTSRDVEQWMERVRDSAPVVSNGLPQVDAIPFIRFFEVETGDGYCTINLSSFNWNRRRKNAHKLDPFGKTKSGMPSKRVAAADVLAKLQKGGTERDKQISVIAHTSLRQLLESDRESAAEHLICWLQQTTTSGLSAATMSSHPADRERRRQLEEFAKVATADVLSPENAASIPWTIGIQCLNRDTGSVRKVNVARSLNGNPAAQFYQSEAVIKELHVGYRLDGGELDRDQPLLFAVSQMDELAEQQRGRWVAIAVDDDSALRGRALGSPGKRSEFRRQWQQEFDQLCDSLGIAKRFTIAQGCVIEKTDGTMFQLRNFDKSKPWMKDGPFKQMRHIHRSPFAAMKAGGGR